MNKWLEILIGLILIIGMILIAYYSAHCASCVGGNWSVAGKSFNFWHAGWEFLKGGVFWFVVLIGLLFLMLGISDLRE